MIVTWHRANFQLKHRVRYKPLRQLDPSMRSVSGFVSSQEQPVQGCHTSSTLPRLIDRLYHYVTSIFSIQHSLVFFPPIPNLSHMANSSDHQHTQPESQFMLKGLGASKWGLVFIPHAWIQHPYVKEQQQNRRRLWYHLLSAKTTKKILPLEEGPLFMSQSFRGERFLDSPHCRHGESFDFSAITRHAA